MEIVKLATVFISGVLFASIGWGFVCLVLWNMYLSAEKRYQNLKKAKFDITPNKTGGFRL